jgi:hypothetical protein
MLDEQEYVLLQIAGDARPRDLALKRESGRVALYAEIDDEEPRHYA